MPRTQQPPEATKQEPTNARGSNTDEFRTRASQLLSELRTEGEALGREQTEIDMLLRQTNGEVEKLAQRELGMTNRVRDMELNLDNYSRTDMKTIYNSAHEIQMRLFMMRAQVEQLEAKRNSMKTLQQHIGRSNSVLQSIPDEFNVGPGGSKNMVSGPLKARGNTGNIAQDLVVDDNKQVLSQVIQAQEDERLYVSRQMHDGPAQTMTNLVLRAEICERLLDIDPVRAKNELVGLKNVVNTTLQDTRRFIFDLRPMILDDLGLEPTLRRYVQQFTDKFKIEVGVTINGLNGRLPGAIEVAIFRIVQEALTNVSKHAHSTHAQVSIDMNSMNGDVVSISIEDDGSGFTADEAKMNNPKFRGLATMRQRVEMYGGQLNINTAPGKGTHITASLPAQLMG